MFYKREYYILPFHERFEMKNQLDNKLYSLYTISSSQVIKLYETLFCLLYVMRAKMRLMFYAKQHNQSTSRFAESNKVGVITFFSSTATGTTLPIVVYCKALYKLFWQMLAKHWQVPSWRQSITNVHTHFVISVLTLSALGMIIIIINLFCCPTRVSSQNERAKAIVHHAQVGRHHTPSFRHA